MGVAVKITPMGKKWLEQRRVPERWILPPSPPPIVVQTRIAGPPPEVPRKRRKEREFIEILIAAERGEITRPAYMPRPPRIRREPYYGVPTAIPPALFAPPPPVSKGRIRLPISPRELENYIRHVDGGMVRGVLRDGRVVRVVRGYDKDYYLSVWSPGEDRLLRGPYGRSDPYVMAREVLALEPVELEFTEYRRPSGAEIVMRARPERERRVRAI